MKDIVKCVREYALVCAIARHWQEGSCQGRTITKGGIFEKKIEINWEILEILYRFYRYYTDFYRYYIDFRKINIIQSNVDKYPNKVPQFSVKLFFFLTDHFMFWKEITNKKK